MKEHTILLIVQPKVGDESTYYSQTPGEENDRIAVAQLIAIEDLDKVYRTMTLSLSGYHPSK